MSNPNNLQACPIIQTNFPRIKQPFDTKWTIKEGDFIPENNSIRDCAATITAKNNDYKTLRSDFIILKEFCGPQVK